MVARCFRLIRKDGNEFVKYSEHWGTSKQVWDDMDRCDGAHEITVYGDGL